MRLLKLLLLALLLLGAAVMIAVATPAGLHAGLWMAQTFLPGELRVGTVNGRLLDRFGISELHYRDDTSGLELRMDDITFAWQPTRLRQRQLVINALTAGSIHATLPDHTAEYSDADAGAIALPLTIQLQRLGIDDLRIDRPHAATLHMQGLQLGAYTADGTVHIERLAFSGHMDEYQLQIDASGRAALDQPWAHDLRIGFAADLPEQPRLAGKIESRGDMAELDLLFRSEAPAGLQLSGTVRNLLDQPQWQLALNSDNTDISPWLEPGTYLDAGINASGNSENINARWEVALSGAIEEALTGSTELRLTGDGTIAVDALALNSPARTLQLNLHGEINHAEPLTAALSGDWSLTEPQPATGTLAINGSLDDYRLALTAASETPLVSRWQLDASGTSESLTIEHLGGQLAEGQVTAAGHLDWQAVPTIQLQGDWQNIVLPLDPDRPLQSDTGSFRVQGDLESYELDSEGSLAGAGLPATRWQLSARGDQTRLQLDELQLHLLDGQVRASGETDWADDTIRVAADIEMSNINPGRQWPEWPGLISGDSELHLLYPPDGNWQLAIRGLGLSGELRDYPFSASGTANVTAQSYTLREIDIRSADSTLQADGLLGDNSDLTWTLDSPDLAQLLPGAGGRLEAEGQLRGNIRQPELTARIDASEVTTEWLQLRELSANADIETAADRFNFTVEALGLQSGDQAVDSLAVDISGLLSRHDLRADITMDERRLDIAGEAGWDNGQWSLNLGSGDFSDPLAGDWQLAEALQLRASATSLAVSRHCWRQNPARLCLAASWQTAGDWQADLELTDFGITESSHRLHPDLLLSNGELAFSLQASGHEAELKNIDGRIRLRDLLFEPDAEVDLRASRIDIDLGGSSAGLNFTVDAQLDEPAPGQISGRVETGALRLDAIEATELAGRLQAHVADLKPWLVLYPRIAAEQAELEADFTLSGTVAEPVLDGNLALAARELGIAELGITLDTFELRVRGDAQQGLTLDGQASSGPGELQLAGRVALADGALTVPELTIKGERFELLNLPEITALASPDLTVQLRDNLLRVDGEVVIPEALLQPFGAPGAISPSGDEIIVSEEMETAPADLDVQANIRVRLGDRVRVTGKGFESRIAGQLDINQRPGRSAAATGELRLVDGAYSAYGQDLKISTGEIIYTNQPVDNPNLNIRATRSIGSVTVGVQVDGTAQQPVTELFSSPSMPEADILSYIVIGRPLNNAGAGDGDALLNAAAAMGIQRSESLRQTIAGTLGIDTLEVETGTTAAGETDARLTIGKYLAPNLYISYGASLVDAAVNTVRLRYEINRFLAVEAEQGVGTGVDLLYQIER